MRVLPLVVLLLSACAGAPSPDAPAKRPNILFVMIDDLGWMDLAVQGNDRFVTPNIDRLAAQGTRYTDFYAAAPVCSPTRAACATGLAPARLQVTNHIPDRWSFYDVRGRSDGPRRGRAWGTHCAPRGVVVRRRTVARTPAPVGQHPRRHRSFSRY